MFVPLSLVKEHCAITAEITDALLQIYIDAAEARAATYLNRTIATLADLDTEGKNAVRLAIVLFVMDAVEQRGTLVVGTISSEMQTAEKLLHPYRIELGV